MAIFASTTTSGYSDPLKALSIKALEQRLAQQAQQQAQAQPDAASMATIPGGIGHVLGVVGDRMNTARTEQAAAAQRQALAQTMAGIDWEKGPTSQQIASLNADPDLMKQVLTTLAENRRAAAQNAVTTRGQDVSATTAREGHGVTREGHKLQADVAREGHGVTREGQQSTAATAAAGQANQAAMTTAEIESREKIAKAEAEAKAAALATDPKRAEAIQSAETDYRKGLSHIANLEEATKILEHPGGIYTGALQSVAPAASGIPGASMFVDKEKAQRTSRFNTIVGEDAIRDMATTLKGSSTNFEMQKFEKMKNDPNISDAARADQLRNVVKAARADLETQARETKTIGGDVARVDRAMSGGGAPAAAAKSPEDTAALEWATKNPDDPRAAKIKQRLGVP